MKPYYEEENIQIYNGDCLEIMPQLGRGVDLVITDPPFDNSLSASMGAGLAKHRTYMKRIYEEFASFDFKIMDETVRLMEIYQGYWFFNIKQLFPYCDFIKKNGFNYSLLFWHKKNPTPLLCNNWLPDIEYIFHIRGKGAYFKPTYQTGSRLLQTNVWKNEYDHPSAKPTYLLYNYILNSSQKNNLILDPFLGSGATTAACKELGRRCIGIELKKEYCDIAIKRLQNTQRDMFI